MINDFGVVVIERMDAGGEDFDAEKYKGNPNIYVIRQEVRMEISSTKVRSLLARGNSVRYLIPDSVIKYIKKHNLYQ